jgi:hypothetical protein
MEQSLTTNEGETELSDLQVPTFNATEINELQQAVNESQGGAFGNWLRQLNIAVGFVQLALKLSQKMPLLEREYDERLKAFTDREAAAIAAADAAEKDAARCIGAARQATADAEAQALESTGQNEALRAEYRALTEQVRELNAQLARIREKVAA